MRLGDLDYLIYLNIGAFYTNNFPLGQMEINGFLGVYIGIPNTFNFPFGTNGKLRVLGAPALKHIRVC